MNDLYRTWFATDDGDVIGPVEDFANRGIDLEESISRLIMRARGLGKNDRARRALYDALLSSVDMDREAAATEAQCAIRAVPQPKAHDVPRAPLVALLEQTTKAPAEAGAKE